jgi:hypothetical protein
MGCGVCAAGVDRVLSKFVAHGGFNKSSIEYTRNGMQNPTIKSSYELTRFGRTGAIDTYTRFTLIVGLRLICLTPSKAVHEIPFYLKHLCCHELLKLLNDIKCGDTCRGTALMFHCCKGVYFVPPGYMCLGRLCLGCTHNGDEGN